MNKLFLIIPFILFCTSCQHSRQQKEDSRLEPVFSDSTYQLTGVAVSGTGRVFTCYPLWSDKYRYALVEAFPSGSVKPYPNDSMNAWQPGRDGSDKWVCVQAVYIDAGNTMWVVDPASPKQNGVYNNCQKLVKINVDSNTVEKIYPLSGTTDNQSYINDVRVDTKTQFAYLTNSSEGGIIIVDLNTGKSRQVLQGNYSVIADRAYKLMIDGKETKKNGVPFKGNSDGITLTPDGQYLYYKPLTDPKLYRIKTQFLRDTTLTPPQLAQKVEKLGSIVTTDGMACDDKGNLYLGDLETHCIVKIAPGGKITTFLKDARLIWPDSYQVAGGYLYISCSQINKQPNFNDGVDKRTTPYSIYRIKLAD